MANESLKSSIENLYQVFAKYPLKEKIEGCPCCVGKRDNRVLHSKPLRKLMAEDLSYFAAKSMTTFGDEDDFKHFLPRLFEILIYDDFDFNEEILFGKLDYAQWQNWDIKEKITIENFFRELIKTAFEFESEKSFQTEIYLAGIACAVEDITPYLELWLESISTNKIQTLKYFVVDCDYGMSNAFLAKLPAQRKQIINWLISEKTVSILEELYFENEVFQNLSELPTILDVIYDLQK
jgi:hypothetical protein